MFYHSTTALTFTHHQQEILKDINKVMVTTNDYIVGLYIVYSKR